MTKKRATLELIFAGVLWGFGFVATSWGIQSFNVTQFLLARFFLSWICGEILLLTVFKVPTQRTWPETKAGLIAGIFLGLTLIFQTIGLKSTTATRSSFITTLYVIFVPLLEDLLNLKKNSWAIYLLALLALIGTWLLTGTFQGSVNTGDLWTLLCSLMAAGHILSVSFLSLKDMNPFRFNTNQSLMCFLITLPLVFLEPAPWSWNFSALSLFGLFMNVVGSTIIAFTIQIRTQKVLNASTASMLFLLESPFAALFGFIFLTERLTLSQTFGAGVILLSAFLTVIRETPHKAHYDN